MDISLHSRGNSNWKFRLSAMLPALSPLSPSMYAPSKILCFKIYHLIYTKTLQRKCLHFNHLTFLYHVSCIQKWLIWFYAVSLLSHLLMMVPYGPKHVAVFSLILWYQYLRNNVVYIVRLALWTGYGNYGNWATRSRLCSPKYSSNYMNIAHSFPVQYRFFKFCLHVFQVFLCQIKPNARNRKLCITTPVHFKLPYEAKVLICILVVRV